MPVADHNGKDALGSPVPRASAQSSGQRVQDKLAWAYEIIERYADLPLEAQQGELMPTFRCTSAFAFFDHGSPIVVTNGEVVTSTKDIRYVGHESNFETVEEFSTRHHRPVEQATAAPGEYRSVTPRPKPSPPPRSAKE